MADADVSRALSGLARSHDLRLGILAAATEGGGKALDPERLGRELPSRPAVAVIAYHLSVLQQADLLPPD